MVARADSVGDERAWFLRALLVLQSPRPVFAALRDDSDEAAEARQDAGRRDRLAGGHRRRAGDHGREHVARRTPRATGSSRRVWAFLAGGLYGFVLYFVSARCCTSALAQARQTGQLSPRAAPARLLGGAGRAGALSLLAVRIAIYGEDLFQFGGADGSTAGTCSRGLFYVFVVCGRSFCSCIGVRTVHGWTGALARGRRLQPRRWRRCC